MDIVQVDEREGTWEDPEPKFRVYLHGVVDEAGPWSTDTYDLTGADALQVIDWAQRQAGDQCVYSIALVGVDVRGMRGLTWLVGRDGNDYPRTDKERDTRFRMLTRRSDPVGVPEADRSAPDAWSPYNDGTKKRQPPQDL